MNQFDIISGIFQPQRTDNLKEGSHAFIGIVARWQAVWIIEDEDSPYFGQWALQPEVDTWLERPPFAWVPQCDVITLEVLEKGSDMSNKQPLIIEGELSLHPLWDSPGDAVSAGINGRDLIDYLLEYFSADPYEEATLAKVRITVETLEV